MRKTSPAVAHLVGLSSHSAGSVFAVLQCGHRYLSVPVPTMEASFIEAARLKVRPERPMSHDLAAEMLKTCGIGLEGVRIEADEAGGMTGVLVLRRGRQRREIKARSVDALVLALRTGAPIHVSAELLPLASGRKSRGRPSGPTEPGVVYRPAHGVSAGLALWLVASGALARRRC